MLNLYDQLHIYDSIIKIVRYLQADLQLNKDVSNDGPSGRRPDISLQIPPRHSGFRRLDHSQSFSKGIPSPGGFLRALSLKRKGNNTADAERSSLLNPDPKTALDSAMAWKRCTSLPVTPATNLSPSVSTPASARTYSEQPKLHVSFLLLHVFAFALFIDFQSKFCT